jgi:hypothetical protein
VFPITVGASYELIDGRVFEAALSRDQAGVEFRERAARRPTVYLLRASVSGGHEVTALWTRRGEMWCRACAEHHPRATPTDFTLWDFAERSG